MRLVLDKIEEVKAGAPKLKEFAGDLADTIKSTYTRVKSEVKNSGAGDSFKQGFLSQFGLDTVTEAEAKGKKKEGVAGNDTTVEGGELATEATPDSFAKQSAIEKETEANEVRQTQLEKQTKTQEDVTALYVISDDFFKETKEHQKKLIELLEEMIEEGGEGGGGPGVNVDLPGRGGRPAGRPGGGKAAGAGRLGQLAANAGRMAVTAAPMALVAGAVAAPFIMAGHEKDKIAANPNAPEYKDNPEAMRVRGEAGSIKEAGAINTQKVIKSAGRRELQDVIASDLTDEEVKKEYGRDKAGLKKWLEENPKSNRYQMNVPVDPNATGTPSREAIDNAAAGAPAPASGTPTSTPGVEKPTSRTEESFNIANEKVIPGQPLSDKQMAVMRSSISSGNTYPPEVMAQYQKQSSGFATRKDAGVAANAQNLTPEDKAKLRAAGADVPADTATPAPTPAPSGSGTGRMINIDIRAEQQAARGKAYEDARRAGKSDQEAQNIAASVGNEVGAAALSREEVTSAIAPRPEVASPAAGGQLQQATTGVANAEADASAAAGGGTTNVVAPSNSTVVNNNSTPTPKDTRNTESTFQKYLDRRYYPTAMR
jgi:hypothetical protein